MVESLYPRDLTIRPLLRQRTVNATTGAWQITEVAGRTDGYVWFSLTRDGAQISNALKVALTNVTGTGYYQATIDGAVFATELSAVRDGTQIWEVVQFGTELPTVKPWRWRPTRPEA